MTPGKGFTLFAILLMFSVGIVATCIHVNSCGDKAGAEAEVFVNSMQYEESVLRRKNPWAQWVTCFSFPRMFNALNLPNAPMESALAGTSPEVAQNLRVMNGMKFWMTLYIMFGNTYLFTYYSIVANPVQADEFRHSFAFLLVSASMFATPVLFWIAGFLHAFSFLEVQEDKRWTFDNLRGYYVRKIVRYLPLVIATLLFALFLVPMLGAGPIWSNYEQSVMLPCQNYWWTNVLLVNNIVPMNASFDQKCMPWAWFIPCLV